MKILMLGWELPPFNSGGLGVACAGLIKALFKKGIQVTLLLPRKLDYNFPFAKILFADSILKIRKKKRRSFFSPYFSPKLTLKIQQREIFGIFEEVLIYQMGARKLAFLENFDLLHAHDWLTFLGALSLKEKTKKPLICHIHATEFDRTGGENLNPFIFEIEKKGLEKADLVVAVSNFTKEKIVKNYKICPEKIKVIYNGIELKREREFKKEIFELKKKGNKIVLFVGRITLQKGPDYFLRGAKKVLEKMENVYFIIVGSGDMEEKIVEQAARLKIANKVLFAGFLRDKALNFIYQSADLFVMPSVSEPFGLTPLEALVNGTPVLISKQSGISEVLFNSLKVDFWDTDEMANKILSVLKYHPLRLTLKKEGQKELRKFSWENCAQKFIEIYQSLIGR